jgi:hypothetical protein
MGKLTAEVGGQGGLPPIGGIIPGGGGPLIGPYGPIGPGPIGPGPRGGVILGPMTGLQGGRVGSIPIMGWPGC